MQVLEEGPTDRPWIDARMGVEMPVFERQGGGDDPRRQGSDRPVAELPPAGAPTSPRKRASRSRRRKVARGASRWARKRAVRRKRAQQSRRVLTIPRRTLQGRRAQASSAPQTGAPETVQRLHVDYFSFRTTSIRAPAELPDTAPSYIISARAAGWMNVPSMLARVRK